MSTAHVVKIGTRGSPLARWQADWVSQQLAQRGIRVEVIPIETTGDVRSGPIGQLATQGVFTKEIQRALLTGQVDLAVHSLKDLPTEAVPGLVLAAVPPRAAVGDALVTMGQVGFDSLAQAARVGTGSLRRRAQLLRLRPDLEMADVRGNIQTRLRKLESGEFQALVLAEAALERLDLSSHIVEVFDWRMMLPAVGQGALGLEIREDDATTRTAVSILNDEWTLFAVTAERSLLRQLRGGCLAPVGAWARQVDGHLRLDAVVLDPRGKERLEVQVVGQGTDALALGITAADQLFAQGASRLIEASRSTGIPRDAS